MIIYHYIPFLTVDSLVDCVNVNLLEWCFPNLCDHHWYYIVPMSGEQCLFHPSPESSQILSVTTDLVVANHNNSQILYI